MPYDVAGNWTTPEWVQRMVNALGQQGMTAERAMQQAYGAAQGAVDNTGLGYKPNFSIPVQPGNAIVPQSVQLPTAAGTGFTFQGGNGIGGASAARAAAVPKDILALGAPDAAAAAAPEAVAQSKLAALLGKIPGGSYLPKAARLAGKVAPLAMGSSFIASALEGQGDGLVPDSATSSLERMGTQIFEGKDNPDLTNLANYGIRVVATPLRTGYSLAKAATNTAEEFVDWAGSKPQKSSKTAEAPRESPMMEFARSVVAGEDQKQATGPMELGQMPNIPGAPQMGRPAEINLDEVRGWMEKAAPTKTAPEDIEKLKTANMIAGLASALGNAQATEGVGQLLGHLGAGVMGGYAKGQEVETEINKKDVEAEQHYAALMAGNTMDLAKLEADQQNRVMEIAYKNAAAAHEQALKVLELKMPKFVGMQGGIALYQTVGQDGKIELNKYDMGALGRQGMYKALGRQSSGDPFLGDAMAGAAAPSNDAMGYTGMIAAQLVNNGLAPTVLGDKTFEAYDGEIKKRINGMPGTDEQRGKLYKEQLQGQIAGELMNNPQALVRASNYSPYAAILLARMEKNKK